MSIKLLYGEETYLRENKLKKLKKDFGEFVKGINFIQIDETNVEEMISDIETPAFGYSQKLMIARNTGLFKKEKKTARTQKSEEKKKSKEASLSDKIAEYVLAHKDIFETDEVTLIFVEEEAEKNELYKAIEKIGEINNFELLKLPQLIENIKKICMAYQVKIDNQTAKYFVECCGTSMQDLINEIRKLIEYVGENGTIKIEDIDKLSIKQLESVIFDLTDNLGKKDITKAMEVLKNLSCNKEPTQKILITLYNHFKKLYIVKIAEKYQKDLALSMKLKPNQLFLCNKYKMQAKYFEEAELKKIMEEFISLDENSKIGNIDLNLGLEAVLCRYCS